MKQWEMFLCSFTIWQRLVICSEKCLLVQVSAGQPTFSVHSYVFFNSICEETYMINSLVGYNMSCGSAVQVQLAHE